MDLEAADPWMEIGRLERHLFEFVEEDVSAQHFAVDFKKLDDWPKKS